VSQQLPELGIAAGWRAAARAARAPGSDVLRARGAGGGDVPRGESDAPPRRVDAFMRTICGRQRGRGRVRVLRGARARRAARRAAAPGGGCGSSARRRLRPAPPARAMAAEMRRARKAPLQPLARLRPQQGRATAGARAAGGRREI